MGGRHGDRRADLLDVAAARFVEEGIAATTMESIARGAGAGKATLYRYFSDKDAVVDALLDREGDRMEALVAGAAADAPDAATRLEERFLAALRFLVTHPLLGEDRDEARDLLERIVASDGRHVDRMLRLFAEVVAEGVASEEFRRARPLAVAEVMVRLLLSYLAFPPMVLRIEDEAQARVLARAIPDGLKGLAID